MYHPKKPWRDFKSWDAHWLWLQIKSQFHQLALGGFGSTWNLQIKDLRWTLPLCMLSIHFQGPLMVLATIIANYCPRHVFWNGSMLMVSDPSGQICRPSLFDQQMEYTCTMQDRGGWWKSWKVRLAVDTLQYQRLFVIVSSLLLKVTHYLEDDFPPTSDMEAHVVRSYAQYSHCTVFLLAQWRCWKWSFLGLFAISGDKETCCAATAV